MELLEKIWVKVTYGKDLNYCEVLINVGYLNSERKIWEWKNVNGKKILVWKEDKWKKKKTNGNYKWKKKKRQLLKDDNYSELMRR